MADRLYQYGSYGFESEGSIISEAPRGMVGRTASADTPATLGGARAQRGRLDPRRLRLSGVLVGALGGGATLDEMLDAFLAALAPGSEQPLYWGRDDRYFLAHVEPVDPQDNVFVDGIPWTAEFVCYDNRPGPTQYSTDLTSTDLDPDGTAVVTNAGTAPALPEAITLDVDDLGTDGTITVENETTGQSFTITPTVVGAIIVNCWAETVTRSGVDITGEFEGEYLLLLPGDNDITIGATGGLTQDDTPTCDHRDRWY